MLERIKHVNSKGEVLDFQSIGIFVNYNELRDYEWTTTSSNNSITGFSKGIVKKPIPFEFCLNEEYADEIKNMFYEHFEKDVYANEPGYFEINDYRYYCYVTKSKKSNYLSDKRFLKMDIEITTDKPSWIRELKFQFDKEVVLETGDTKTYQYQYSYEYGKTHGNSPLAVEGMKPFDFKIIIYGTVSKPTISIGGNIYSVECDVSNSEYLVIDSRLREIYLMSMGGEKINIFNKRNKEYNIFQKIEPGYSLVAWSGAFGFDLIVYDERSEPKWN